MSDKRITRPSARPSCQVLVVGAGPAGLVLAAGLPVRGVSTRIIGNGDGVNLETSLPSPVHHPSGRTRRTAHALQPTSLTMTHGRRNYPRGRHRAAAAAAHTPGTLSSTEAPMMFLTCPAYLDQDSALRCGLPAEVGCRFTMHSTGGPLESVMIRCPAGHCFSGPIESLTPDSTDNHDPSPAGPGSSARRDSLQHGHDDQGPAGPAVCPRRAGAERSPPEHRSGLLPGPPCRPVDHRHAPAPPRQHPPSPDRSRCQRR